MRWLSRRQRVDVQMSPWRVQHLQQPQTSPTNEPSQPQKDTPRRVCSQMQDTASSDMPSHSYTTPASLQQSMQNRPTKDSSLTSTAAQIVLDRQYCERTNPNQRTAARQTPVTPVPSPIAARADAFHAHIQQHLTKYATDSQLQLVDMARSTECLVW